MKKTNGFNSFIFRSYLEDGEEIELVIHKHIVYLLKKLVFNFVLFGLAPAWVWSLAPKLALPAIIIMTIGCWRIFYQSISYFFNAVLVTNLNLVEVVWNGFFERSAIRLEYNQIESFSYKITGFLNTVINCGNVVIAKNSGTEIVLPNLFRPKKQTQTLTKFQDQFMTNHQQRQSGAIKDLLTSMLEQHILEHGLVIDDK